mmetsp:Transcript_26098/g.47337  ORF Transcript_26098/g.47337 Transcript_26098/m.47337 type:complete len:80 (+) Transcript_26098:359-598(+)
MTRQVDALSQHARNHKSFRSLTFRQTIATCATCIAIALKMAAPLLIPTSNILKSTKAVGKEIWQSAFQVRLKKQSDLSL